MRQRRGYLFNDPEFLVGRKAICGYLGMSWRTVLRWKKKYGFGGLLLSDINGDPVLIKSEAKRWFFLYNEYIRKHKEEERMTRDGQSSDNSDASTMQASCEN